METFVKIMLGGIFAFGFYLGWKLSNFFISFEDMIEESLIGLLGIKLGISAAFGAATVGGALWLYAYFIS